jgi:DNA repair protein RecN (Recombination protein N)
VIRELRVRDLATIGDVTLSLGPGLNVLTGETGAGKSMLVDALALLLGARADSGSVRSSAKRLLVEGVIEGSSPELTSTLEDLGLDSAEQPLVLRREVTVEGRSRGWVNGSPVSMGSLSAIGELLVDLHGQHETRTLLEPARQREVVDEYGDTAGLAAEVAEQYGRVEGLRKEEVELVARRDEVRRRADYLRHVVKEIEGAGLRLGEDDDLDTEAKRLAHAGALTGLARTIAEALDGDDGSALGALAAADKALSQIEKTDPSVDSWHELLDSAFAQLQELARLAGDYAETLAEDPGRLAEIESRRDLLYRLKQKYGETIEQVLDAGRNAAAELDLVDRADFDLKALGRRRDEAEGVLRATAGRLTEKRTAAAKRLGREVTRLLPRLGLTDGVVTLEVAPLDTVTSHGAEDLRLMAQLNPGLDPRPFSSSASGGELSRVMLAIKTVLGSHDRVPTLVFDEVDQGIGGEVGSAVAYLLASVSERHQVLVITHLPTIAARADTHLMVAKAVQGGFATSDVAVLHGEDRVLELARMLGDPDSATARRHALALLTASQGAKPGPNRP